MTKLQIYNTMVEFWELKLVYPGISLQNLLLFPQEQIFVLKYVSEWPGLPTVPLLAQATHFQPLSQALKLPKHKLMTMNKNSDLK